MKRALALFGLLVLAACASPRPTDAPIRGAANRPAELPAWGTPTEPVAQGRGGVELGVAHWYGNQFHGRRTASGEVFNQNGLTAAHLSLPFGTMVRVTNVATGQSVVVRINDRHGGVAGVIIDLSREAARRIGALRATQVRLEVVGR